MELILHEANVGNLRDCVSELFGNLGCDNDAVDLLVLGEMLADPAHVTENLPERVIGATTELKLKNVKVAGLCGRKM